MLSGGIAPKDLLLLIFPSLVNIFFCISICLSNSETLPSAKFCGTNFPRTARSRMSDRSFGMPLGASAIVSKVSRKVLRSIDYLSLADQTPEISINKPPAKMAIASPAGITSIQLMVSMYPHPIDCSKHDCNAALRSSRAWSAVVAAS